MSSWPELSEDRPLLDESSAEQKQTKGRWETVNI